MLPVAALATGRQEPDAATELPVTAVDFEQDVLAFLDRYCLHCHEGEEGEGGIDLALAWTEEEAREDAELYWQAAWKIWDHAMPPPRRKKQPTPEERARFLAWVDAPTGLGRPGQSAATVLRRMNRDVYRRSIHDLLGVEVPAEILATLPEDEAGDGFDNSGAALTLSADAVLRYLDAAEKIAALAVYDLAPELSSRRWLGSELEAPHQSGNAAALWSQGEAIALFQAPRAGRYRLRVGAWGDQAGEEACRLALRVDGRSFAEQEIPSSSGEETIAETTVTLGKGSHRLGAAFLNDYYRPEQEAGTARDRNLYVSWVEVQGPLDSLPPTPFQEALYRQHKLARTLPGQAPGYGAMLEELLARIWRRSPTREEGRRFAQLVWNEEKWEQVVRLSLTAALTSPNFLFETMAEPERRSAASRRDLHGPELATRLAFFLWGSVPDHALLQESRDPAWAQDDQALLATVARMLADPRSHALAEDFASQCFRIRGLEEHQVDQELFPQVDQALLVSMREETLHLFEDILQHDRDLRDLLTASDTFLDRRLAAHYGMTWPEGAEGWQRFDLSSTSRRGILGHAGVLTMTSMATRTSPVRRGRWIMDNLLGAAPPPPPADAGLLDESPQASQEAPLRERLAAHRTKPLCASCHKVMDPLGFSLEHYDAIGRWRDHVGAFPVDAGGRLPDGTELTGLLDLVQTLDARDSFPRLLLQRLCSYALGRPLVPADRLLVQGILYKLDPQHPTLRRAIEEIVLSEAFRSRPVARRVAERDWPEELR